ncbi:MAG: hypothetical protein AAGC64_01360 [Bacteroidota bacterium]
MVTFNDGFHPLFFIGNIDYTIIMPANKQYLLQTRLGRTSKVFAALFGSLFATISLHLALVPFIGIETMIPTAMYSTFLIWVFFMVMVYWIKKPWKAWFLLLSIILISVISIVINKV